MLDLNFWKGRVGVSALGGMVVATGLLVGGQTGCGTSRCDMDCSTSTSVQITATDGWIEGAVYELRVDDASSSLRDPETCVFRWSDAQDFRCGRYGVRTEGRAAQLGLYHQVYKDVRVLLTSNGSTLLDASLPSDKKTEETCAGPCSSYSADFSFDHSPVGGTLPTIPLCLDCPSSYAMGEVDVSCFCAAHDCPESKDAALAPRPGERVEVTTCDGVDLVAWPDADDPQTLAYAGNTIRDVRVQLQSGACQDQPYELTSPGYPEPSSCGAPCIVSADMLVAERGACLTDEEANGIDSSR